MVLVDSDKVSPASPYSGYCYVIQLLRLQDFHLLRLHFPKHSAIFVCSIAQSYNPNEHAHWFGLFRFRSPLLTESLLVFFSSSYLDVSVQRVYDILSLSLQLSGLPHSDTYGSKVVCTSPYIFAAYHVLRRLREPRHSPCALISLPYPIAYDYYQSRLPFFTPLLLAKYLLKFPLLLYSQPCQ